MGAHGWNECVYYCLRYLSKVALRTRRPRSQMSGTRGSMFGVEGSGHGTVEIGPGRGSAAEGSVGKNEVRGGKPHLAGGVEQSWPGGCGVDGRR
jgi:hypothetical protein